VNLGVKINIIYKKVEHFTKQNHTSS